MAALSLALGCMTVDALARNALIIIPGKASIRLHYVYSGVGTSECPGKIEVRAPGIHHDGENWSVTPEGDRFLIDQPVLEREQKWARSVFEAIQGVGYPHIGTAV